MGSNTGMPNERPARITQVSAFKLDRSPVTVAQFGKFVAEGPYQTSADQFGNSAVFDMTRGRWHLVQGANWEYPLGPDAASATSDHPVTQVSWYDADKYCRAKNGRLPSEAEFEYAAKGAGRMGNPTYAFGDKVVEDGAYLVNIYNGQFPYRNTGEDGFLYTAPVGKTGITPLGFTDMAGNVWEWSADWYSSQQQEKTLRGGSFLCDEDVCHGYRTSARSHSSPETSLAHVGFRCAYDLSEES